MNFGKWIFVSFVLFAAFIATLVGVCVRQDVNLVSKEYYSDELKHQQKMTHIQNVRLLAEPPEISVTENVVKISFPQFEKIEKGELHILRPSDEHLDHKFRLASIKDTVQYFPLKPWTPGLYRASMEWTMGGRDYYFEKLIVL